MPTTNSMAPAVLAAIGGGPTMLSLASASNLLRYLVMGVPPCLAWKGVRLILVPGTYSRQETIGVASLLIPMIGQPINRR